MWIDTHCHLDAPEFGASHALAHTLRQRAAGLGVGLCVIPAVERANFDTVRQLAHQLGDAYALGIHPLFVPQAQEADVQALDAALNQHRDDPRLVAVGEIGLDFFVPALCEGAMRERQTWFYREQLKLARKHGLPVILHVRRSADALLKHLREVPTGGGIAHAFNGSEQQAQAFLGLGFKLGFGGALTFEPAQRLRRLASTLPLAALVLETDAPDIPPIGCTPRPPSAWMDVCKASTHPSSCRALPLWWRVCVACPWLIWRRPPRPTPCRRCPGWRVCCRKAWHERSAGPFPSKLAPQPAGRRRTSLPPARPGPGAGAAHAAAGVGQFSECGVFAGAAVLRSPAKPFLENSGCVVGAAADADALPRTPGCAARPRPGLVGCVRRLRARGQLRR
jgi:TatD DNase family protein